MHVNKFKKNISIVLIGTVLITSCLLSYETNKVDASTEGEKEEVVYGVLDSQGNTSGVYIVNSFTKGQVSDYGEYSKVVPLNTEDQLKMIDDRIEFSTSASKMFYKGICKNSELPWNIHISYTLDGKYVEATQIAGKDGHVVLTIDITQNNNCPESFFDTYTLQGTVQLDGNKCTNITSPGATVSNVGEKKQLSYIIMPGQGRKITISFDAKDFSMGAMNFNGIRLNLGMGDAFSQIGTSIEALEKGLEDVDSATGKLSGGSEKVSTGAGILSEKTNSVANGASKLRKGINGLDAGLKRLSESIEEINSNSPALMEKSQEVKDAISSINTALKGVSITTEDLTKLTTSSQAVLSGISTLDDNAKAVRASLNYDSYMSALSKAGINIDGMKLQNTACAEKLAQLKTLLTTQYNLLEDSEANRETRASLKSQIDLLTMAVATINGNNSIYNGIDSFNQNYFASVDEKLQVLSTNTGKLKTNYTNLDEKIRQLATKLDSLSTLLASLTGSISQLNSLYGLFHGKLGEYTEALNEIKDGLRLITDQLPEMVEGVELLSKGTIILSQKSQMMAESTLAINQGLRKLRIGTSTLDKKATSKIGGIDERLAPIEGLITSGGSEIVSFASKKNGCISSVQFVIKIKGIDKENKANSSKESAKKITLWQKIKNLFK